ncbi:MAG TPA: Gfo/Idh/MocA family oxidoreductase [Candidatus Latescibacteria bacterium]|nr:Gfo/Idh/MocA family oxidoreductase [Candidatus Latescibacterota bacterium]
MLRTCVIGLGPIGNRHADIHQADPLATLVGVCDWNPERAEAAGKRLGVPFFTDAAKMLESLRPDMVSVATGGHEYGSEHAAATMVALEHGCHVLCEKPISNELEPARKMVALAREKRLCFAVNLNHRFTPACRHARKWLAEGRIGIPRFMNMAMWIGNPRESSPWFHFKALHPHTIDIMRYFCGEIEAVHAFAIKAPGRTIWSTAQFNFRFKSGATGHLTGSYDIMRGHPMERAEVGGTRGRILLEDMFKELTLFPHDSSEKIVVTNPIIGGMGDFTDTFINRIHNFFVELTEGVPHDRIDGQAADALAAQAVIDANIRSMRTGKVERVDPGSWTGNYDLSYGKPGDSPV